MNAIRLNIFDFITLPDDDPQTIFTLFVRVSQQRLAPPHRASFRRGSWAVSLFALLSGQPNGDDAERERFSRCDGAAAGQRSSR
jgi:hypothetical protein